jgi:hypothetical protein
MPSCADNRPRRDIAVAAVHGMDVLLILLRVLGFVFGRGGEDPNLSAFAASNPDASPPSGGDIDPISGNQMEDRVPDGEDQVFITLAGT